MARQIKRRPTKKAIYVFWEGESEEAYSKYLKNLFSAKSTIRTHSETDDVGCNTDMDELSNIMPGGDAFITKPYNTAILHAGIASLLRRVHTFQDNPGYRRS